MVSAVQVAAVHKTAAVQDDNDVLSIHPTAKFSVLGQRVHEKHDINSGNNQKSRTKIMNIFLDINQVYTRQMIQAAFAACQQRKQFRIILGPGTGMEAISCPIDCDFQWSEYERIDWDTVLQGQHGRHIGASSYCIRKGLCRKAQLAQYVHRYICKHPDNILKTAIPQTIIIDTWPVWETTSNNEEEGLANVIVSMTTGGCSSNNRRYRLDTCLSHVKCVMDEAVQRFNEQQQDNDDDDDDDMDVSFPVWILKPSTINKGAGIQIVHLYVQVVDICWDEPDIREWYVLERMCVLWCKNIILLAYLCV